MTTFLLMTMTNLRSRCTYFYVISIINLTGRCPIVKVKVKTIMRDRCTIFV